MDSSDKKIESVRTQIKKWEHKSRPTEDKACFRSGELTGVQNKIQASEQHRPASEQHQPTWKQHQTTPELHRNTQEDQSNLQLTLFHRLGLEDKYNDKLTRTMFLEISPTQEDNVKPSNEKELVQAFMQQLLSVDCKARHITVNAGPTISKAQHTGGDVWCAMFKKMTVNTETRQDHIHPMDVQMAVFLCADHFLQQTIVTKLQECQYALPLLVPNPFTGKIEFPLWTMRQINKSWKKTEPSGQVINKTLPMYKAETPMVAFFRLGSVSSSKSQLMNSLINEKHNTFFHRDCTGSSRNRLLMDGVVEITWYLPSGKSTDHFPDCVAFCNLHGDSNTYATQRKILTEMASANVVLVPELDENDKNLVFVQELCKSSTPLIVLLTEVGDENKICVAEIGERTYRMYLKGTNRRDVSDSLRGVINNCLLQTSKTFRLEYVTKYSSLDELSLDEHNKDCQRGKEAAQRIMEFLERQDPSTIKETNLPYQGKLWHDWCQKKKDLRRLKTTNIKREKSRIQHEMRQIRKKQQACEMTELMQVFVENLDSLSVGEKMYFLHWIRILLDEFTSEKLSGIHQEYDIKWKQVMDLKKKHDEFDSPKSEQIFMKKTSSHFPIKHEKTNKLKTEQSNLENLSNKLIAATFGLEHILREMGQIYEASGSKKKGMTKDEIEVFSHLPRLAAEHMTSGFPMELMDGDAAHVPLVWVSAVLDELIKILGDQRVFVLSVLGIQSSGKSTMLNAMFGLQFPVSAGRCTRGAFMQLVKVSEEMKTDLKFDYILVVDTEGLRALELAGSAMIHHDNELATFVVGLGSLTLINIFGENPAEMQDILQIVVHAFMRMKKVRLNPSCMFVHQNVSDVSANEKIMDGRRRLEETLDKQTKLTAKHEVCDAEYFSEIIAFDVQKDVKYFAQLWEGSPPMAPPNTCYSANIRELKKDILSRASKTNCIKLSQFQIRVKCLWNALLDEDFVFSFKNAQEIAVYMKLEKEYEKWIWSLRTTMLSIEEKMFNRVASGTVDTVERQELIKEMSSTMENVQNEFKLHFEEDGDKEILSQWKCRFEKQIEHLHEDLINDAKRKMDNIIKHKNIKRRVDQELANYENELFEKSKELALGFKENGKISVPHAEFELMWGKWVSDLTKYATKIEDVDISNDVINVLTETHERSLVILRSNSSEYKDILFLGDYNKYVSLKKNNMNKKILIPEDQNLIRNLISTITEQAKQKVDSFTLLKQGYKSGYIHDIAYNVKIKVENSKHKSFDFKPEFIIDLSLYVCNEATNCFKECHRTFMESNDPIIYLKKKQYEYYRVFEKFLDGGTSVAILGDQICCKLKESIKSSIYNMMARFVCSQMRGKPPFNGNRADLEKHILKSLAEQKGNKNEKFYNYLKYFYYPRSHFEKFIQERVKEYIETENPQAVSVIAQYLEDKKINIISTAKMTTDKIKHVSADANVWLEMFSKSLVDELGDIRVHMRRDEFKEITDYNLLVEVITQELSKVVEELKCSLSKLSSFRMETFREQPDEILINHFCRCCWEQCPFCGAVCTNSQKDHTGDHNADFHRPSVMNGITYRDTTEFFIDICTSAVASDKLFYLPSDPETAIPYKQYRKAGGKYAKWCISTDFTDLAYWKWFIFEFQANLEKHHNKKFCGKGKIPAEWEKYNQELGVASLGLNE